MKKDEHLSTMACNEFSEATCTGGFVSVLTVANKAPALLLLSVIMSEKKDCLDNVSLYKCQNEPGDLFFTTCTWLFNIPFFPF